MKILSLPPYLSTPWENISCLKAQPHSNGVFTLIVTLKDGTISNVPNLSKESIDVIFHQHTQFHQPSSSIKEMGLGEFQSILQHDPSRSNYPLLPSEVLNHLSEMTLYLSKEELNSIPKPEPDCLCPHCQITRSLHKISEEDCSEFEETVDEKDLSFRSWDIKQLAEHLYQVTNPLNDKEVYQVFLSTPIGCTCGNKDCEHIQTVLRS